VWNWLKESLFPSRRQFKLLRSKFKQESFHIYYHLLIAHQSSGYGVLAITVHKKLLDQQSKISESVLSKFFIYCVETFVLQSISLSSNFLLLSLPILFGFDFSLGFKSLNDISSIPSHVGSKLSKHSWVSVSFESENFECLWDNQSLLLIVWVWDAVEDL